MMTFSNLTRACALTVVLSLPAMGQPTASTPQGAIQQPANPHAGHEMPVTKDQKGNTAPQDHSQMQHTNQNMQMNDGGMYLMNMASGTSVNPQSWPMPMMMRRSGTWNLMFMSQAYFVTTQQSGPRGGDKVYAPNWFMGSAEHSLGGGSLMFQAMFSLDPATITKRRYPLLFQTGETAFGKPIVDGQHPHDFLMSLGVHYAHRLGERTMMQFYYAPIGDPALGPVAFPHRASAFELPQATLGHHWQDSTHIAANVATVAVKYDWLRLEASGFHGTEPNENRWNIDWGAMNSYSGRIAVFPSKNWMAQVSAGRLKQPEHHDSADIVRTTASLHYIRPLSGGTAWSTSLIWGRNHNTLSKHNLNSYLLETLYPLTQKNFLTGRIELVDKDELFADNHDLEHQLEHTAGSTFRIQAYTVGYTRDIGTFKSIETGIGASVTAYAIAPAIKPYYGEHPCGLSIYLRFRLKPVN